MQHHLLINVCLLRLFSPSSVRPTPPQLSSVSPTLPRLFSPSGVSSTLCDCSALQVHDSNSPIIVPPFNQTSPRLFKPSSVSPTIPRLFSPSSVSPTHPQFSPSSLSLTPLQAHNGTSSRCLTSFTSPTSSKEYSLHCEVYSTVATHLLGGRSMPMYNTR